MAELIPVEAFDLIIFGGNGDLASRKLLPALFHRFCDGQITNDSRIIGVGREELDQAAFIGNLKQAFETINPLAVGEKFQPFSALIDYVQLDALDHGSWQKLVERLKGHEHKATTVYLATHPTLFGSIANGLSNNGLIHDQMRIVLEKPVGHDYESASNINDEVGTCFRESQVFRIDHYLGKETVQNLLALRFGNSLFEPLWRREVIDHVQITVAEDLGVESRLDFYNRTGALRDMVQNHLMQLVCLVAMEPPSSLSDDSVRDEKIKVLRALKPIGAGEVKTHTVRGQYTAGAVAGEAVNGYAEQLKDGESLQTETFVAIKLEVDNWRWSGIPFYLRTGKRLERKHSEILIQFKQVPHSIFDTEHFSTLPNRLSIMLQPDEGMKLNIMAKEPGPGGFKLKAVSLDLSFEQTFGVKYPDSYERLLMEIFRGNQALFMRRDEIETAWQWTDSILEGWESAGQSLEYYKAGSWGPTGAFLMLDRDDRHWATG